ncbi:hypothetical protein ACOSQ2_006219 [Xanthoceras sorbifolium]
MRSFNYCKFTFYPIDSNKILFSYFLKSKIRNQNQNSRSTPRTPNSHKFLSIYHLSTRPISSVKSPSCLFSHRLKPPNIQSGNWRYKSEAASSQVIEKARNSR